MGFALLIIAQKYLKRSISSFMYYPNYIVGTEIREGYAPSVP